MPQDDFAEDDIIVIGKSSKPSPQPRLVIDYASGGGGGPVTDFNDLWSQLFRSVFVSESDFDASNEFNTEQRKAMDFIVKALQSHPRWASFFQDMREKGVDVNIRAARTSDGLNNNDVAKLQRQGDPNRPLERGETVEIIIKLDFNGRPIGIELFKATFLHEMLHLIGDLGVDIELDREGSTFDIEALNDLYRNYVEDDAIASLVISSSSGGVTQGSSGNDIIAGSNAADIIYAGLGSNIIDSKAGDDVIYVSVGSGLDQIVDTSGIDKIVFGNGFTASSLTTRWSADGTELTLLIYGNPEVVITAANSVGSIELIEIGGSIYAITDFSSSVNEAPVQNTVHQDHFGTFSGGFVTSAATSDSNNDRITYSIGSVSGDYALENWQIDKQTGAISGFFYKEDQRGSQFTDIVVLSTDGIVTSQTVVRIRWAYSSETSPELGAEYQPNYYSEYDDSQSMLYNSTDADYF